MPTAPSVILHNWIKDCYPKICRKIDNKVIQVKGEMYCGVDTILYFAFLNILRWLNIAIITPHGPDDGSVELKRCSVYSSINLSFHLDYLVINFSLSLSLYIYIYIYTHTRVCVWGE